MQYHCGYCKLEYLWEYPAATVCTATPITVAAEYTKGTPTYSSHSGTALYETYVAGQRKLDMYTILIMCTGVNVMPTSNFCCKLLKYIAFIVGVQYC